MCIIVCFTGFDIINFENNLRGQPHIDSSNAKRHMGPIEWVVNLCDVEKLKSKFPFSEK